MSPKKRRRGSGEGGIWQRPDGRWCAAVDLGVVSGKRQRKYVYGKTRKEVAEKLKQLHTQQAQGIKLTGGTKSVSQHLAWWLEHVVKADSAVSTYATYESLIRNHIDPAIGAVKLRDLTAERAQELWSALGQTLKPSSVIVCRAILSGAMELAVRWGDVPRNVVRATTVPQPAKHTPPETDQGRAKTFLRAARGDRFAVLYHIALETGARLGELRALRVGDVDLDGRRLHIRGSWGKGGRGPTKNGEPRTIAISPQLTARLTPLCAGAPGDLLFMGDADGPPDANTIRAHFKAALAKAGLPPMRFHDLRHWAASLMLASGVGPGVVQARLGHSSYKITMDVYGHLITEIEDRAAETMGQLLEDEKEREA